MPHIEDIWEHGGLDEYDRRVTRGTSLFIPKAARVLR